MYVAGPACARGGGPRSARGWRWLALETGEIDDARFMFARGNEAQQIGRCHRGRAIVRQRVIVERVVLEHCGIEHWPDAHPDIVDERKGRDTPGAHPEELVEIVSAAEREARRPEPGRQLFQVGAALLEHDREPEPALLVLEEEALAVPSRQAAA